MLNRFDWKRLPRPVIPLDDNAQWQLSQAATAAIPR